MIEGIYDLVIEALYETDFSRKQTLLLRILDEMGFEVESVRESLMNRFGDDHQDWPE